MNDSKTSLVNDIFPINLELGVELFTEQYKAYIFITVLRKYQDVSFRKNTINIVLFNLYSRNPDFFLLKEIASLFSLHS